MRFGEIFSRRNIILLRELVVTDFKLRYQGSVLGYTWSLLKPLFLFAILYVVFGVLVRFGSVEHYSVYLLLGIVLWTFFVEATSQGLSSIVSRGDIIRKINLPKSIIVLSTTVSALVNLIFNMVIVFVFMAISKVTIGPSAIFALFFVIEIYILSLGLAFLLSTLNVKFRDIGHIWEIVMQGAFYATPIIYPLQIVVEKSHLGAQILMMNPIAQAIQDARYFLITSDSLTVTDLFDSWGYILVPFCIVIVILFVGIWLFRRNSSNFAENI